MVQDVNIRNRNVGFTLLLPRDVLLGGDCIQGIHVFLFEEVLEFCEDVEALVLSNEIVLFCQHILLPQRLRFALLLVDVGHNAIRFPFIFHEGHLLLRHLIFGEAVGAAAVENTDGLLGNGIRVVFDRSVG